MAFWLVKTEAASFSWDQQVERGTVNWDGVRNHQAALNLKAMKKGDRVFFYHSVDEKRIVGVVEVVKEAYLDPKDPAGKFVQVDLKTVGPVPKPVTLADIKAEPTLQDLALIRQSRLSVMPVPAASWKKLCTMGGFKG